MATRKAAKIEQALLSKGFRFDNTHHRYLILYVKDRATAVRTYVSHSDPDYGDNLLARVQKQLRLPRKKDLLDLVDCPMTAGDYVALLQDQGIL